MPKVSVIVPVYGVEKYIERCARSLFEQTLDDIEYLFIDDCTPDRSIEILQQVLEEYPQRKPQVIIHRMEKNSGQAAVRKWGMQNATGEYVIHCDSDDWVDADMYRAMYEKAKEDDTDLVICNYFVHDGTRLLKTMYVCNNSIADGFRNNFLLHESNWALWNKLFRRTSNDIIYPKGNMGEDIAICAQLILQCKKIAYVDNPFYYYYKNSDSISHNLTTDKILCNFNAIKDNTDIVLNVYSQIDNKRIKSGLLYIQYIVKVHLFPIIHRKEYRRLFLNTYPNLFSKMLFSLDIPCECKLKYIWALMGFYPRKID